MNKRLKKDMTILSKHAKAHGDCLGEIKLANSKYNRQHYKPPTCGKVVVKTSRVAHN